jgi:hypothetical protein
MGTIAIKKDRRDKSSKGAVLRTKKPAAKVEKATTSPKSKKIEKPKKAVKVVKAAKKPIKTAPAKAVVEKKGKAGPPRVVEAKKPTNATVAKKQAAPKKAQTGKATMARAESAKTEVRAISTTSEPYKIKEGHCPNCSIFSNCRRRDFSEQAMTVLLLWGEIAAASVDQPICDDCYEELREVLIDRAQEVDAALTGKGVDRVREMISRAAS